MKPRFSALVAATVIGACSSGSDFSRSAEDVIVEPVISEEIVVAESPAEAAALSKSSAPAGIRTPRRGVLTAGDIDDVLNLAAFGRYQSRAARAEKLPGLNLSKPVLARVTTFDGKPAAGVRVTLRKRGAAEPFYQGYSGVDGLVTVFPGAFGHGGQGKVEMRAFPEGQLSPVAQVLERNGRRQVVEIPGKADWTPDFLDLAFVVDTTGSMGDELAWLTKELKSIVRQAKRAAPGVDIRYGLIVYRDHGDDYVLRNYGFTKRQSEMQSWLRAQSAQGGGDYPEAAAQALRAATDLNWRRGKGERLMFHIADAPPHHRDARAYLDAARAAAAKDVQVFGLGASGVGAASELLMRQAAVVSNGRYLFLTDDSGVGYGHAEPTISCYQVSRLNDLMVRVLKSELSGHRVEARPGKVIRQVGTYQRGVCRN
ncbi:MAG: vWA domain-containing protein [Pseudomonadota bacterium]